jgi:hypothetical protein
MLAPAQLAHHLLDDAFKLLKRPDYIWLIFGAVSGLCAPWVRKWQKQVKTRTVRDWLSVSASIDVVSVAERRDDKKHYYAAVLTYFYRRPDLQIGEYEREFPTKAAAQQWVKQFKGRSVMVHVNPQNPADSFLLDSDLEGLDTHHTHGMAAPTAIVMPPALPPGYRFLCGLGEVLSIAGVATCAVLLAMSHSTGGKMHQQWIFWAAGSMLVFTFVSMYAVQFNIHFTESHNFLSNCKQWTPAWMRWSLKISVALFIPLLFLDRLSVNLPPALQLWMDGLASRLPYLLAGMVFLFTASFHSAILRSQELVQLPVSDM